MDHGLAEDGSSVLIRDCNMTDKYARKLAELAPKIMSSFHDPGREHPGEKNISMRQFQALVVISSKEGLTLSQICEKLGLAPSTATELMNRMIGMGLISKTGEEGDKRQVHLQLTPMGIELLKRRQEAMADLFQRFLATFPAPEQENFVRHFEGIWELIEKYHQS